LKNYIKFIFKGKFADDSDEENEEIKFKHNPINNNSSLNMVNYLASEHAKGL